jgi:D-3-phosphoglycerate dehydrogenase
MSDFRVVVTDHDFDDLAIERDVLDGLATVEDLSDDASGSGGAALLDALDGAHAVLNRRRPLDADHLRVLAEGAIVAGYGIGVDNVDLAAAAEEGIPVTNVPEYCIEEVATHTVALALALVRGVKPFDRSTAEGHWDRDRGPRIRRLSTMTVGVVGFGSIGRAVADRFLALGATVVTSDPYVEESEVSRDVSLVSFDSLVDRADVLTVHSPLTESTDGLLDADVFERFSDEGYIVNVARGPIVDTDDLLAALDAGDLAGAGLDVFPEEPPPQDESLCDHPSVISTPHVAWYSEEANGERREVAAGIVRRALAGEPVENVVNDVAPDEHC